MINLKIDPEFQSQIPPLTNDEFKQLEENILKEGKLISPLIVWNNTLVDGHNRYAILQKHPEIYFSTMPLPFENREEVLAWICKNQLGRRNLTPEQKYYLMGKQYEAEKAVHGGDRKSTDAKSSSLNANLIDSSKTCDRIAAENGVSKDTVIRASKYMRGVEIAEDLMPGLKQSILSGQTKVSKADMHRLAKAAYYDRAQILQDILHPEDRPAPQSSYSHYSGINYSALEVAVRRIQQDVDFLMKYLPKVPDDAYPLIPMKPSNVWHGHSTRPSLPAGTVRKVSGSLPRGRRNRLILQEKKNRKLPLGNSLLYISLSSVAFGRVRPAGHTLFLFCPQSSNP